MAVTLKQIANDLGVSVVTVSKVLRNHQDISKRTRDMVLKHARDVGYRPNLNARSLVTGRSSLVGLLVPDLLHPFFAEVAKALAAALRKQGVYLLLCSSEGDVELERHQIEHLLSRGLDAIVVAPLGGDEESLQAVIASQTVLVLIDRSVAVDGAHFIGSDDIMAGRLATEHLISQGCKRIAHLRGPGNSVGEARLEGYRKALQKAGIPLDSTLITEVSTGDVQSRTQGAEFAQHLLTSPRPPDGLFCHSDPMAIGAMQCALQRGLAVPRQLAVVGCGNLHYDDVLAVPLTSIDQRSAQIGQKAAALILERTQRGKYEEVSDQPVANVTTTRLKPALVPRASSVRHARE